MLKYVECLAFVNKVEGIVFKKIFSIGDNSILYLSQSTVSIGIAIFFYFLKKLNLLFYNKYFFYF